MIQQQIIDRGITDAAVIGAMRRVPREKFFPRDARESVYADRAAPIGYGQTISQPYIVALMTQHLQLRKSDRVLEVGTGSGYQTAILAELGGEIFSIERVKPLLDQAFERIMDLGVRNVHFRLGDGARGWADAEPFDRILISAGAPALPEQMLLQQLKDGGIAVLPVGPHDEQMLLQVTRQGQELRQVNLCPCRFVKLIGQGAWSEGDEE